MKVKIIMLVIIMICVTSVFGVAQIDRKYEPIVLKGDTLSAFLLEQIEHLYLFRYDGNQDSWQMIPFQFDEVNPDVNDSLKYFEPEDSLGGLLDADDELVFMAADLGDKADQDTWVADTDTFRIEIAFFDSLKNVSGYVYLYYSETMTEPIPDTYKIHYDSSADEIMTAHYRAGFNNTGQLADVAIDPDIGGSGTDIFDRTKIRGIGSFFVLPIFLNEDNFQQRLAYVKHGKVRIIRNMVGNFVFGLLNLTEKFTQTSFFYPWHGSFVLVEIPIKDVKDVGAEIDVFRVSWDFNENATGMRFYSEGNPDGLVIDGVEDSSVVTDCHSGELNWTMGTGQQGTMLNVFHVPSLGDNIQFYYHEDKTSGTTGDPMIQRDTGDKMSFGDNGLLLYGNIQNYITEETTLDVRYHNFFLPPDFSPDSASAILQQLNSPLGFQTKLEKYTRPSFVEREPATEPVNITLVKNYPNPFNASTMIEFHLEKTSHVTLKIYDALGRLVNTIVDANFSSGIHQINWDGKNSEGDALASGLYFYKLTTDYEWIMRKSLLIR